MKACYSGTVLLKMRIPCEGKHNSVLIYFPCFIEDSPRRVPVSPVKQHSFAPLTCALLLLERKQCPLLCVSLYESHTSALHMGITRTLTHAYTHAQAHITQGILCLRARQAGSLWKVFIPSPTRLCVTYAHIFSHAIIIAYLLHAQILITL